MKKFLQLTKQDDDPSFMLPHGCIISPLVLPRSNQTATRSFSTTTDIEQSSPTRSSTALNSKPSFRRQSAFTVEPRLPSLSLALAAALSPTLQPLSAPHPANRGITGMPSPPASADKKQLRKLHAKAAKLQPKLTPLLRERDVIITSVNEMHRKSASKLAMLKMMKKRDHEFNAGYAAALKMHKARLEKARQRLRGVATEDQYRRFMEKFQLKEERPLSLPTFPVLEIPDWS
ncbi:hypothetical protein MIND_00994000 [Mycena indigotica]|uniref:Uncharacterized protein n=1 Tax=Mycena indigotica TaxID=2126181 RepID=A0A8H6S7Q6_9AGAR|nr:uncharacterized protein MIND_00994000 [Mycena indigotica]KAF7294575.1 hypothetical protein MIND_00994000 [Mycena indigotica]